MEPGRALVKAPPKAVSAKRKAAPPPGRDNNVSPSRNNLLTTVFWQTEATRLSSENIQYFYVIQNLTEDFCRDIPTASTRIQPRRPLKLPVTCPWASLGRAFSV